MHYQIATFSMCPARLFSHPPIASPMRGSADISSAMVGADVPGCISPGERAIATAIREAGFPLIAIVPRGFGPYFKPKGEYFDACAEGRLLMISPYAPMTKKEPLTRTRCFEINSLAARLCGEDPNAITYRGSSPRDFGL